MQTMHPSRVLYVLLTLVSPGTSLKASSSLKLKSDAVLDLGERPVSKVIGLLKDTKAELQVELKDDEDVHEMLTCWCKDNREEKGQAIAVGKAQKSRLETLINTTAAKIANVGEKREAAYKELQADKDSLTALRTLRIKENKEFHARENDLIEAIKASEGAITVLSVDNGEGLAQIRSATRSLLKLDAVRSATGVTKERVQKLTALLQGTDGVASFLQKGPGYQSYTPQSAQVFGMLKQMKDDFEESIAELRDTEAKSVSEFEEAKKAKEEEIALGEKEVATMDSVIADALETKAKAEKNHAAVFFQLKLDIQFMTNLKIKCKKDEDTYDERVKSRMEEIAAIEDAIGILSTDDAFAVFDKMAAVPKNSPMNPLLSFVQTSSKRSEDAARRRAVMVLQQAAARTGAAHLASIAASARIDAFTKVKEEIDKMVAQLKKQMTDEVKYRDMCIKDLNINERETAAASDALDTSKTKKEVLIKDMGELSDALNTEMKEIAEISASMKEKTEDREAEAAEAHLTISDHQLMTTILQKAINRLKQVYLEFLQKRQPGGPHTQTSATHTDPGNGPARFKTYEPAKGNQLIGMLENILEHTRKTGDEAQQDEQDTQTGYESFMKDSNTIVIAASKAVAEMKEQMAKMKMDLSDTNGDIDDSTAELKRLAGGKAAIKESCDYTLDNFAVRQDARSKEIAALGDAKQLLSGKKERTIVLD